MAKIQGYIGERDPIFSILIVSMQNKKKNQVKRDYLAIERFKQSNGSFAYMETPINANLIGGLAEMTKYLESYRLQRGRFTTDPSNWNAGTTHTETKKKARKPSARGSITPDYTAEIGGDLHRKTTPRIKQIIKMAEGANREFFQELDPDFKRKSRR